MPAIRFSWDPHPDPTVIGFQLYAGRATLDYTAPGSPKDMGFATFGTFDINADGDWFFALTAYSSTLISQHSAEITGRFITPNGGGIISVSLVPVVSRGTILPPALTAVQVLTGGSPRIARGSVMLPRGSIRGT